MRHMETIVPEKVTAYYPNGESATFDREYYNSMNGLPRGTVRCVNRFDGTGNHYYDASGNELSLKRCDGIVRRGCAV